MLFDSSILIAHLRGDVRARDLLLAAAARDAAHASVISRTELEGGMRSGEHRASHPGIDLADYLIGATAENHGLQLVTLNVRHFPMLRGLRPAWS